MKAAAPLQYVGVFRNAEIADVCDKASRLMLAAVQLHGGEDQAYVDALRAALPAQVQIWKALSVGETLPARDYRSVDKYVLDNGGAAAASVSTGRYCRDRRWITFC